MSKNQATAWLFIFLVVMYENQMVAQKLFPNYNVWK
jgi:hypothetical protein